MSRQAAAKFLQIFLKIIENHPKVPARPDVTGSDKGKSRERSALSKMPDQRCFQNKCDFSQDFFKSTLKFGKSLT
jgi:hypothetical protein